MLKYIACLYNLLLSLGAFYLGVSMILGRGFETFPPEWVGKIPFQSWMDIALFGMIIFGIGNAIASIYGFIRKERIFTLTILMGALLFFCTVISTNLLGEWYLPTGMLLIMSILQLSLGLIGLAVNVLINFKSKLS